VRIATQVRLKPDSTRNLVRLQADSTWSPASGGRKQNFEPAIDIVQPRVVFLKVMFLTRPPVRSYLSIQKIGTSHEVRVM
jgi:hypothetical protein